MIVKPFVSLATLILCLLTAAGAGAANVSVIPELEFARRSDQILIRISYDIPSSYHAYANKTGGAGLPTTVDLTIEDLGKMPVIYPRGDREKDIFDPSKQINVYKGRVSMLAIAPLEATGAMYVLKMNMLLCSNKRCVPFKESIAGKAPASIPFLADVAWRDEATRLLDREAESAGAISLEEGKAPKPIEIGGDKLDPSVGGGDAERKKKGREAVTQPDDFELDLSPRYTEESVESYTLWKGAILGLLAGLILNAMPCVLPVLTLKVSGLFLMGNADDKQKLRLFRDHNIYFAIGVLSFFTFLAVALGAADLMWGQLYQNQTLLLTMLILVFLMGLSLLGVFTLPAFDLRAGTESSNPKIKSYITGLVSTFLATPCSGPLLGGVLAWSFAQPLLVMLVIFWCVGVGMALPYIIFSIWPNLARILPRPGDWMYVFEHILGFLLLGTALYLFSILPQSKHIHILIVLLLTAMGAWLWGKYCNLTAPLSRRRIWGAASLCGLVFAIFWIARPIAHTPAWQEFTPENFMDNLGKKNMLVEFTADWCPNCKLLEATVLTEKDLFKWKKNYDLQLIKVDLTQTDPYAQKLLEMLGSKSIPLTAIFGKGQRASEPVVLRDIYGKQTLNQALSDTLSGTKG
ncbi:MAG: thioredoxin family protein [Desulfovibrio sp.]|nr:thioredoxin family protein [Desulfovibrio sp.]